MPALRPEALDEIGETMPVPAYDRPADAAGVVHIGVGGFHRAHQAMYHDRLLERGEGDGWGILGVGVLETDAALAEALHEQDGLYTLVLKHGDGRLEPRVVGSLFGYLHAAEDQEPLLARIADPATRIVSMTVTEGGYTEDNRTWDLLAEALGRRRDAGAGAVTVMSCDNLPHNGERAREVLLARARAADADLAAWIEAEVAFPSSMVDRITPRTTDEDRRDVQERFGVRDRWPVVCEPFAQWVLEDRFAAGRPPYEAAGVQVVDDVGPYELMKLRLLNAGHQALCHFGSLLGHEHVHEAAADPLLRRLLDGWWDEAVPTLPPVEGVDLAEYRATLLERFANPQVRDTVARLCADASDRMPKFLLPVIGEDLEAGRDVRHAAAVVAAWALRMELGEAVQDVRADALTERARRAGEDPLAFLRDEELFGGLAADERFTGPYAETLGTLRADGARAALEQLTA